MSGWRRASLPWPNILTISSSTRLHSSGLRFPLIARSGQLSLTCTWMRTTRKMRCRQLIHGQLRPSLPSAILLENERAEWELPGGKLGLGEDPPDCVVREISEEAGWKVTAGPLLDCWQYHIREGRDVVIVTYGCHVLSSDPPVVSNEHKQAGLFTPGQVPELVMPDGYKRSVAVWAARLNEQRVP